MKHNNIKKYYRDINKFLLGLQDQKPLRPFNRNYCYFFTSENNENLSICAEFINTDGYYGISPSLNIRSIIQIIKDGVYNNQDTFDSIVEEYVNDYWNKDSIDDFGLEQRRALMARSLVNIKNCFIVDKDNRWVLNNQYDSLYNGVNNRLVEVNSDYFEVSGKTNYIKFKLQRTTFFTSLSFKHVDNVLLNKYKYILDAIDSYEDNCFNILQNNLKNCPSQQASIDYLNIYLNASKQTHYINVSANITTKDNDLIHCLRGPSEDKSTLYCSANGVSEVYDENVDYYMFSVNEDVPTIHIDKSVNRIDFSSEINREIRAELNIENMTNIYEFYGFTIMGKISDGKLIDACHINVLTSTHCYEDFEEICKHHDNAIEKSEIDRILGWRIKIFDDLFYAFTYYIMLIGKLILEYDKLFFALCVLFTFKDKIYTFEFDNGFDKTISIISMVVLVLSLCKLIKKYNKKLHTIHTTVINRNRVKVFDDYVKYYHNRISRFKYKDKEHYIYEIMALCHYLDSVEE